MRCYGPMAPYLSVWKGAVSVHADNMEIVFERDGSISVDGAEGTDEHIDEQIEFCSKFMARENRKLHAELRGINDEINALQERRSLLWRMIEATGTDEGED